MLTHILEGGIGNQLFQMATALALSLKTNHELYFEYVPGTLIATCPLFARLRPLCKSSEECRALESHLPVQVVDDTREEHVFEEVYRTESHTKLFKLRGYFQSWEYVKDGIMHLVELLDLDGHRLRVYEEYVQGFAPTQRVQGSKPSHRDLQSPNPTKSDERTRNAVIGGFGVQGFVSTPTVPDLVVHFRMGDYKHLQHTHLIMPCSYYQRAVQRALESKGLTHARIVYVFEEQDQEYVTYYVSRLTRYFPETTWFPIRHDMPSWDQLLYMSLCDTLVVGNSTFSLWAAYLSDSLTTTETRVYYPSTWFFIDGKVHPTAHFVANQDGDAEGVIHFVYSNQYTCNVLPNIEGMFLPSWFRVDTTLDPSVDNVGNPSSNEEQRPEPAYLCQCLCYNNPKKAANMARRFQEVGLELRIFGGVPHTDPRILNRGDRNIPLSLQRLWSVTYGHLDMIAHFLRSEKPYGIFCEDDVMIRRDLPTYLPRLMKECDTLGVDCLLIGYMTTHKIDDNQPGYAELELSDADDPTDRPYTYHAYPRDQWGAHMYMLSREGAAAILETFAKSYADKYKDDPERPFSPDWTVTKCPGVRRALVYPMMAVEDGQDSYEHYGHEGQWRFHMDTFRHNFVPGVFI